MALIVNKENFKSEVLESSKPVLVDFYADWCGPCRMLAPVIEEISAERTDIKVCKINVDNDTELAAAYGVMSIPSLFVFKNGEVTNHALGALPKAEILDLI